ncbi:hypothetical protein IW138_004602 [Coemansia sp. RSA 986]|nr:hypothetical protein LPJ74_004897 [Coemansia sp. RSA 1843]KAJ2087904.1 hypothetical protein IW138_004602 [Coemansia sp. RSA 986]
MRRLRRVISKQSTSPQSSPVATDGNAGWSGDRGEERATVISSEAAVPGGGGGGGGGGSSSDYSKESPSFLGIDRWPIIGRSSLRRRETDTPTINMNTSTQPASDKRTRQSMHHRSSQSFSMPFTSDSTIAATTTTPPRDWRILRDASKHKRTSSSSVLPSKLPQKLSFTGGLFSSGNKGGSSGAQQAGNPGAQTSPTISGRLRRSLTDATPYIPHETTGFIGYPPGGMEVESDDGLVLLCEQKSPDICEYTVRRDSVGLRLSDILAIALVSWAAHIFFGGPTLLAFVPMVVYLLWSSTRVYQESLVVIRNVGIQTETTTLAGLRTVCSFELPQIEDLFVHEAILLFEYRYYMAILPRERKDSVVIMFPQLLPRLDMLLHVYHGARQLLLGDVCMGTTSRTTFG